MSRSGVWLRSHGDQTCPGNLHEQSITTLWQHSAELAEVRRLAMDVKAAVDQHGAPDMGFCPGSAELETGSPTRLYPAIHCLLSGTRREDLLYHPEEWERVKLLRKAMAALPPIEAMEKLIENLQATKTNAELLLSGLK